MPLMKLHNLTKSYHSDGVDTQVLKNISFEIKKGEFVSIMGPSGSGKSTLLHILGFLDSSSSGKYYFKDKTMEDYTEDEIAMVRNKKMGFVFQSFNLLPKLTVMENVRMPLFYSDAPAAEWNQRTQTAIDAVGLTHRTNFESYRLSGGEKQRTAIARALVNKPDVIFADEPTGNLDSKSGQTVIDILCDLNKKQGHTIILITHEYDTAYMADRIIHIFDGQVKSDEKVDPKKRTKYTGGRKLKNYKN